MNLYFSDEDSRLTDEIRSMMQTAAEAAVRLEFGDEIPDPSAADIEIGVTVTGAGEIQELNREYRGIDKVTDVLSFPQYATAEDIAEDIISGAEMLLGDVVICFDRACAQAEEYGTGIRRELVYLFTHSVLHLMGYDHMDDDERAVMRAREEEIMTFTGAGR